MRAKNKVVSSALCALLLLAFGVTAQAQVVHNVTQQNNEVVQYGLTELMGEVTFTANALCVPCNSIASSITITYLGAQISNTNTTGGVVTGGNTLDHPAGIQLIVSGGYATNFGTPTGVNISAINTALGGQIILTIPAGLAINASDQIRVNGARTDVSSRAVGASINAVISSAPSNANTFNSVSVTVATVNSSMTVAVTGAVIPICVTPTNPTIRITEGFATAFVEYTSPGAGARPRFGATGDTRVRVQVNSLPSGVTLSWPATVTGSSSTGAATGATLVLESGSTSSVAIYTFNTTDQANSDTLQEFFSIRPVVSRCGDRRLWPGYGSGSVVARCYLDDDHPLCASFEKRSG